MPQHKKRSLCLHLVQSPCHWCLWYSFWASIPLSSPINSQNTEFAPISSWPFPWLCLGRVSVVLISRTRPREDQGHEALVTWSFATNRKTYRDSLYCIQHEGFLSCTGYDPCLGQPRELASFVSVQSRSRGGWNYITKLLNSFFLWASPM